ncbi:hypothetical protein EOD39_9244 [Acipenser ruthenus]|uniref:Uncharacterized protein n=1 Tax=Acipenser ruthenus TaxID=7906 RepID=A0A662YVA7_ACIRT|nr:hypothetical protein EOD39_9244 [Acipenser ruthenus]
MPRSVRVRTTKIATDSSPVSWDPDINIIRNLDEDLVREDDPVDRSLQAIPEARSAILQRSETHQTGNIVSHNSVRSSTSKTSKKWSARLFPMLCCIVILSVVAFLLAFVYVFLKGLLLFEMGNYYSILIEINIRIKLPDAFVADLEFHDHYSWAVI